MSLQLDLSQAKAQMKTMANMRAAKPDDAIQPPPSSVAHRPRA
jgi:hypothetical protein